MKKILLIADAAAGLPPAGKPAAAATPPPAVLTVDTKKLEADVKDLIARLEKDAGILPPLLGIALTNLRGAANVIAGHNTANKA